MQKIKKNKSILFLSLVAFLVVCVWFSEGKQLFGGEESLSIFNQRDPLILNAIWEKPGTGFPNATYLVRIPISLFVQTLNKTGLDLWFIQSLVFFLLISSGMIGCYFLVKELFKDLIFLEYVAVFSATFYFLNLYSMTQVWGRFLYSGMFLWAMLPVFLLTWINLVNKKKLMRFLFFGIVSVIFCLTYLQPAFIMAIWILAGLYSIIILISKRKDPKELVRLSIIWLTGFIFWLVLNLWWLYPNIVLSKEVFSDITGYKANLDSLRGVSQYFKSSQIIFLRQSFLLGPLSEYYNFYSLPISSLMSLLIFGTVVLGIFKSWKLKSGKVLLVILIFGWFICKGTNPPLGNIFYNFLFANFSFAQALRNTYEKMGLLIVLPYSIFFGLGICYLYQMIKPVVAKNIFVLIVWLSAICLVWPMLTSSIFKRNSLTIPNEYFQVNEYINLNTSMTRILILPIYPGEAAKYDWGYNGLEPSEFLFDRPAVSRLINVNKLSAGKYMDLYNALQDNKDIARLLEDMNIRFIVLHHDLFSHDNRADSEKLEKFLKTIPSIKFINTYGNLSLYEYQNTKEEYFKTDNTSVKLSYKKYSQEKYEVAISGANEPFSLILPETYSNNWLASIDGHPLTEHSVANGFANRWIINRSGDFNVNIIYKVWP